LGVKLNVLAYLLALVERIPATFWGVVIGAFFSLGGVVLTNRAHDRRLRTQLEHDRELKNRDREMSLRKDVYLAATEAVSAGLIAVGRFADLEVPHDKLTEGYLDRAPSIAKTHVIASETTAKTIVTFSGELGATFLRLFASRMPLVGQKQEIDFLRNQIAAFAKERDRTLELMKQYNLDGVSDQRKWDVLQRNFDFERHRIDETARKADALASTLYPRQLQFMEECVEETMRLGRLLVPIIVSVRKELELPIDEAEYRKVAEEAVARQVESLREFMQKVRSLIAAQPPVAPERQQPPSASAAAR
jgi:hypothetical protein